MFLSYHSEDIEHDGSRIVIAINAIMEDYLAKRDTGEVVKGRKGFFPVKTVWTFLLKDKKWRVANIEDIGYYSSQTSVMKGRNIDPDRLIVITDRQSHDPVPDPEELGYMINIASCKNGVGYNP